MPLARQPVSGEPPVSHASESTSVGGGVSPEPARSVAAVAARPLTATTLSGIWSSALERLEPMTASNAGKAERVELDGEKGIRLTFPAEATMSMRRLELPEHKGALMEAIAELVGHTVSLTMVASGASSAKPAPKANARLTGKQKLERMREIEGHPMVQACKVAFGAEVVKVDHPQ